MDCNKLRYYLTIESIRYSDAYNKNFDLFNRGIQILEKRIKHQDYSEFNIEERITLEEISTIMENI